ncbi:MAG: hypothetical protein HY006_00900 [Candidatus Sungbacteria bacterium]|nr:hypothetical protein [Candidatus Sungbacteria bacterium]
MPDPVDKKFANQQLGAEMTPLFQRNINLLQEKMLAQARRTAKNANQATLDVSLIIALGNTLTGLGYHQEAIAVAPKTSLEEVADVLARIFEVTQPRGSIAELFKMMVTTGGT